mgnify:CR=1 FL=1
MNETDEILLILTQIKLINLYKNLIGNELFRFSYNQYWRGLQKAINALNLNDLRLSPHSARAGKATHDVLSGISVAEVQERGRWVREKGSVSVSFLSLCRPFLAFLLSNFYRL